MLIVRSPVRISFGGGGTDLPAYYQKYGGAVLSATINKYFYTVLTKRDDDKIQVISSDLQRSEAWQDIACMNIGGQPLDIPLAIVKHLGIHTPLNLFLASEIPPGTGLGSSASVCVNILKALAVYEQIPMSKRDLAEKAFYISHDVLGKAVGKQDEYAAAFGGLNYISFHQDGSTSVDPLELPADVHCEFQNNLMLVFTGASHNSWNILKAQEQATRQSTGKTVDSLHQIRRLASEMRTALLAGNLKEFGCLLDEAWSAKRRVSDRISDSRIDHLYQTARQSGALGGKITGAGGGGFLLLYCERDCQPKVREALGREGLRELGFEFDYQGARVLVNDPFLDDDGRCGLRWTLTPCYEEAA
ncbi:MAG: GHMP kinase [Acidobacteriia bacterium]|nr:GHMP kinase [Terriglobia bacterium]